MITVTITYQAAMGKNAEAVEFLHRYAAHLKELTGSDRRLLNRVGGPMGQFIVVASYDDLAAFEAARSKIMGSSTTQRLMAQAAADQVFSVAPEMALWADA